MKPKTSAIDLGHVARVVGPRHLLGLLPGQWRRRQLGRAFDAAELLERHLIFGFPLFPLRLGFQIASHISAPAAENRMKPASAILALSFDGGCEPGYISGSTTSFGLSLVVCMEPSGIRPHPGFQAGWGQYGDCPFLDFSRRAPSLLAVAPEKPASASDVPEEFAGSSKKSFQGIGPRDQSKAMRDSGSRNLAKTGSLACRTGMEKGDESQ
jgi:hypothetical protein